ncbi:MAG: hypothetical protein NTX64_03205 [Elusimicrobia bacterium]|nr:hypothetical protein [Elusimicrobiota bacterium]
MMRRAARAILEEAEIRDQAVKALVRRKKPACIPLLSHMLMNPVAGDAALNVLSKSAGQRGLRDFVLRQLGSKIRSARLDAAALLADLPVAEALPLLKKYAASDADLELRELCLSALLNLLRERVCSAKDVGRVFAAAAGHRSPRIRQTALRGLAATRDPAYAALLRKAGKDPDPVIRNVLAPMLKAACRRKAAALSRAG